MGANTNNDFIGGGYKGTVGSSSVRHDTHVGVDRRGNPGVSVSISIPCLIM